MWSNWWLRYQVYFRRNLAASFSSSITQVAEFLLKDTWYINHQFEQSGSALDFPILSALLLLWWQGWLYFSVFLVLYFCFGVFLTSTNFFHIVSNENMKWVRIGENLADSYPTFRLSICKYLLQSVQTDFLVDPDQEEIGWGFAKILGLYMLRRKFA